MCLNQTLLALDCGKNTHKHVFTIFENTLSFDGNFSVRNASHHIILLDKKKEHNKSFMNLHKCHIEDQHNVFHIWVFRGCWYFGQRKAGHEVLNYNVLLCISIMLQCSNPDNKHKAALSFSCLCQLKRWCCNKMRLHSCPW